MASREVVLTWALRLYEAVEKVDSDVVKDLVYRKGANSDIILPKYGISAFHLAVGIEPVSFSKEVTATFLVSGGNPNVRSSEGLTPVHVASIWGRAENLKLLLLAGGDPMTLDDEGCSPLHYAKEKDHLVCIEIIQKFLRANAYCRPALGIFSIQGREMEPSKRENLIDLMMRKSFNRQNQPLDIPGCRITMNTGYNGQNSDECCLGQEAINQLTQNIIIDNKNLISEDSRSEGFLHVIEGVAYSPQGDTGNKRSFRVCDETYSIHSSPEVRHSNSHYSVDDYMNQDCSENALSAVCEEPNNCKTVKNTTQTISVHDSPYNYWSNSYLTNDISIERGWSPVGDNYDCQTRAPASNLSYVSFMLSAESSRSSTPLQRRIRKISRGCFEKICVVPRKPCDFSSDNSSMLSISCPEIYQKCFEEESKNITKRRKVPCGSQVESKIFTISRSESEEYFTVPEEVYDITDEEERIILKEKRLETPVLAGRVVFRRTEELPQEGQMCRASSSSSLTSCCTEDIRRELYKVVSCGCRCPLGPITSTTKRVYLKMIKKFKMANAHLMSSEPLLPPICSYSNKKFSRELEETLIKPSKLSHGKYFELEQKMMMQFDGNGKWREGNQKSSFNYILLDPRMTLNLPLRWANNDSLDKSFYSDGSSRYWREFLSSIFYIGKGKRSRPYSHLYEAVTTWRSNCSDANKPKKKMKQIIEIWKENLGVVCVHLFQNVIPAEALTREAAMIDALGLANLTNEQRGKYYGLISSLGFSEKRYFGSFLLHRALILFLAEGERQIKPADID